MSKVIARPVIVESSPTLVPPTLIGRATSSTVLPLDAGRDRSQKPTPDQMGRFAPLPIQHVRDRLLLSPTRAPQNRFASQCSRERSRSLFQNSILLARSCRRARAAVCAEAGPARAVGRRRDKRNQSRWPATRFVSLLEHVSLL
ncbi:MAG: hypothetical protein JWM21_3376 [Acidobacteria bacterium]|nr:hypothetical protein [Acidobacteriota bacterium]